MFVDMRRRCLSISHIDIFILILYNPERGENMKRFLAYKHIPLVIYLAVWMVSVLCFYLFEANSDGMGYSVLVLWIILPVTTFIVSYYMRRRHYLGKAVWLMPVFFGLMYMLAEYMTFSLANSLAFGRVNMPEYSMILYGAVFSLAGLGAGFRLE